MLWQQCHGSASFPQILYSGHLRTLMMGCLAYNTEGRCTMKNESSISPHNQSALSEEEISDVSLATFYASDKENAGRNLRGGPCKPEIRRLKGGPCSDLKWG
jgi:hypothetical protein